VPVLADDDVIVHGDAERRPYGLHRIRTKHPAVLGELCSPSSDEADGALTSTKDCILILFWG